MNDPFIDTNVFLRHLLNDDPVKAKACFSLVAAVERRELAAWTSDLVIAEIVLVLSNKKTYNQSREAIRDSLLPLILLPGLKIASKRLYRRIFEIYTTVLIDYIDCFHAALIEASSRPAIYSYDTDFDGLPSIERVEP